MSSVATEQVRTRVVTRAKATQIANLLRDHKHVREVLLFGSLARDGAGHDIDLIVITDPDRANDFLELTDDYIRTFELEEQTRRTILGNQRNGAYHHKALRIEAAGEAIGDGFYSLLLRAIGLVLPAYIDLFVFPPNWRENLGALQNALPHTDPKFMENVARDAIPI